MRCVSFLAAPVLLAACAATTDPKLPIRSGTYVFEHRDAEFDSPGFPVAVTIRGYNIFVAYDGPNVCMREMQGPNNVIYDSVLMWHQESAQWILGYDDADRDADEVGGCSGGPETVDFEKRIIWSCVCGP